MPSHLTRDQIEDARTLAEQGYAVQAIADLFGVHRSTIYRHIEGEHATEEALEAVREAYGRIVALRAADSPQSRLLDRIFEGATGWELNP
jgi:IS30 family transposase